jgi:hypothetical protein
MYKFCITVFKILTTICLCSFSYGVLLAAGPSRFPVNPLAKWKITNISYEPEGSFQKITEKYEYFIHSDTLINTHNYYKLYKSGVAFYDTPFYFDSVYVGAIRDDDNKIYFLKKNEITEILLLDYNLKLGDIIHSAIGKDFIVNFIDTLPDGRKRIWSKPEACGGCCTTILLIEGIGHSGGIMENPPCEHIGFYGTYLNCFEINGELIFENDMSLVNCENFFSSIYNFKDEIKIDIYPVPAISKLTVEWTKLLNNYSMLYIYNISGSLLLAQKLPLNSNKIEINLQNLSAGIYIIKIFNKETCISKRFIKE